MWEWLTSIWGNKKDPKPPKSNGIVASEFTKRYTKGLLSKIKEKLSK